MGYRPMWELKQQTDGQLDVYIYGDVEAEKFNYNTFEYEESENSANHFKEVLEENKDAKQINVYINSYGGSVFEGTAIYNQLKRHQAHKTVYIDGFACSIASVIAMAGDEIVMPRNAMMMVHNMWTVAIGNAAELRKAADDLDIINNAGRQAYLEKAGDKLDEAFLAEMMNSETWLTAEDCLAFGLCDRIGETVKTDEEVVQRTEESIQERIAFQKTLLSTLKGLTEGEIEEEPEAEAEQEPAEEPAEEVAEEKKSNLMQLFTKVL